MDIECYQSSSISFLVRNDFGGRLSPFLVLVHRYVTFRPSVAARKLRCYADIGSSDQLLMPLQYVLDEMGFR